VQQSVESVCLSQVGVLSKKDKRINLFWHCRLLSTSPTLCFMEIQVSSGEDDIHFYRATLWPCVRTSVRLSQVRVLSKRQNTKQYHTIAQHSSFLMPKILANSTGMTPYEGAKCRRVGPKKSATLDK